MFEVTIKDPLIITIDIELPKSRKTAETNSIFL